MLHTRRVCPPAGILLPVFSVGLFWVAADPLLSPSNPSNPLRGFRRLGFERNLWAGVLSLLGQGCGLLGAKISPGLKGALQLLSSSK